MPPPTHPGHPSLTPSLCLQTDSLRAFLRLSRAATDDPINQHLSSLNRPSEQPFDPASFSAARASSPQQRSILPQSCAAFVSHTLFPAWAARARVLEYCAGVAVERTGDPPAGNGAGQDAGLGRGRRQWGGTIQGGDLAIGAGVVGPEAQSQRRDQHSPTTGTLDQEAFATRQKVVDERLDPYSARDYTDETAEERIARVVREEKTVENIVRARSWAVVRDRCGRSVDDWEDGMKRWAGEMNRMSSQMANETDSGTQSPAPGWKAFWTGASP